MSRTDLCRYIAGLAALCLSACAAVDQATQFAQSTTVPVWAVVGERVLKGQVTLYPDRSASLQAAEQENNGLSCRGAMRYTSSTGGALQLRCSDGSQAQLAYVALTAISGYGRASVAAGAVSFTYGMEPEAARAWLIAPPGKRLFVREDSLVLDWLK